MEAESQQGAESRPGLDLNPGQDVLGHIRVPREAHERSSSALAFHSFLEPSLPSSLSWCHHPGPPGLWRQHVAFLSTEPTESSNFSKSSGRKTYNVDVRVRVATETASPPRGRDQAGRANGTEVRELPGQSKQRQENSVGTGEAHLAAPSGAARHGQAPPTPNTQASPPPARWLACKAQTRHSSAVRQPFSRVPRRGTEN